MNISELILYEDKDMVVCHKPAGVLSQADRGFAQDMVSSLMTYEKKKGVAVPFVAPVNRLDRPVEGLILFAKNSKSAAALTKQITSSQVDKCYYAVVECKDGEKGAIAEAGKEEKVLLIDYLVKDSKTNTSRVADKNTKDAKRAELEYVVIRHNNGRSLLDIKLHTGRHHQIRVQLSHAGMPLVGDTKYNNLFQKESSPEAVSNGKNWQNIALCSYRMEFKHPMTGKSMIFTTKPKSDAFSDFF